MKRAIRFYRLKPGYYFTRQPVEIRGKLTTHAVIEQSDNGAFWTLRLEAVPGWTETAQTYSGAKQALRQLIAGALCPSWS